MTPHKLIKKWPKFDMPWGGQNCQKSIILGRGVPGGQFYKFFEILQFFAKAPPLFDPKIDPYKWTYKNEIPHKNACTFAPRGVEKCHFLGGRRADRSDRKM
jgi:hypothetical protein